MHFNQRPITPDMISCNSHEGHGLLIKEIKEFEKEHKKRFEFWVWQPNCMNPQVIFIEITNKEYNSDIKLEEFVKNAQVTFVYKGWIII